MNIYLCLAPPLQYQHHGGSRGKDGGGSQQSSLTFEFDSIRLLEKKRYVLSAVVPGSFKTLMRRMGNVVCCSELHTPHRPSKVRLSRLHAIVYSKIVCFYHVYEMYGIGMCSHIFLCGQPKTLEVVRVHYTTMVTILQKHRCYERLL